MIFRTYLGLDVRPGELRAVALRRRGKGTTLTGGRIFDLAPGVLTPGLREPNIRDPRRFVEGVREVLAPLAGREERIALCLPETSGRVLLLETDTVFKSRSEGLEIVRWQLRNTLPGDLRDLQLDYQVLERGDSGRTRLVAALLSRPVLSQFEELLAEAGFAAAIIDFQSLHLYNYYRPRLEPGEDFVLIGVEGGLLSLQLFQGGILTFHRTRETAAEPPRIFQELRRSLAGGQEHHAALGRAPVYLHCDWEVREPVLEAVKSIFEKEVILLDPHLERLLPAQAQFSRSQAVRLVAAVGAAERMIWRGGE